ncbi:hypothetical protein MUN84_18925 [Hymenobacter sp. 5516J-16]|uniref:hypothetical protein n=1 Tax=Hymenobacter sp. 5516J-16 TaxID=2932253 RepID=UPI001FD1CB8B|nr:hypothetical protein [Hymenobacter sp. 5516J-16]UOQ76582.1 hypothetical protein MUN84_18925 [Hymenobacter sp. 5516J-16]
MAGVVAVAVRGSGALPDAGPISAPAHIRKLHLHGLLAVTHLVGLSHMLAAGLGLGHLVIIATATAPIHGRVVLAGNGRV